MKLNYKSIGVCTVVYWLIIAPLFGLAQKSVKIRFAVVNVVIQDTSLLNGSTIEFNMCEKGINTALPGYTESYKQEIKSKVTRIVIPLSEPITYGRIEFINPQMLDNTHMWDRPLDANNNLFLFQKGDTVTIHIASGRNGVSFTGKSAAKYNCAYRISNSDRITSYSKYNAYAKLKDYYSAFGAKKAQFDSVYAVQLKVLSTYKGKLDPVIYNLMGLDCWAAYNQRMVDVYLRSVFMMGKESAYKAAKALFIKEYDNYKESLFNDPVLLIQSYRYGDFLVSKEKAFAVIMNSTTEKNYYDDLKFIDVNKAINLHYKKGTLKDKIELLTFLNIDRTRQSDFVKYIDEAINEAGNNQFRIGLLEFKAVNAVGTNAFPFELPDESGKVNKLSDFKGKIIVMDFWFTGCEGCIEMAKALKPIASSFKNNSNIVFISVSIDGEKYKELWRKSLTEELYSSKDEINLLAILNKQSAIIKHYNIDSFPTLIIISKDGKIISTAPPDPRIDFKSFEGLINKYL